MGWTRANIRDKVRKHLGRLSEAELSNAEIDKRINQFEYTFDAEVKLDRNFTYYELTTDANEAVYTFDNDSYTNIESPGTIDDQSIQWYQDPFYFEKSNPLVKYRAYPWTGDGSTVSFSTTVSDYPISPGTIIIYDNTEKFEDTTSSWTTSNINLTGDAGGSSTINLDTGVISVTFNTAPANGQQILLSFNQFNPGRPIAMLFYDNEIKFYPPPDTAYKFKCKAWKRLVPTTSSTSTPLLDQWGPALAIGTARDMAAEYGEIDLYQELQALYKEQIRYVLNRTTQNMTNERAFPRW